jgi:glycerophosphoryl diester phosphodiesterase
MTQVVLAHFVLSHIFPDDDISDEAITERVEQTPKVKWVKENGIQVKTLTFDDLNQMQRDCHVIAELDDHQRTEYFLRF